MKKYFRPLACCVLAWTAMNTCEAQDSPARAFPQELVNRALIPVQVPVIPAIDVSQAGVPSGALQLIKQFGPTGMPLAGQATSAIDTLFVGVVPNDTVVIDSVYSQNGPILVFNDGVLIFQNADATIYGDVFVFQNGSVIADSSVLFFPQQYFYQRSWIVGNQGSTVIRNSTLQYNGLSHNLVVSDSGSLYMENVVNNDWTTAGAWGHCTIQVDGTNLGGEYILSNEAQVSFKHTETLLLWHHFPDSSVVDFSFPDGDSLYAYQFDDGVVGISGVGYHVDADSCTDVWWGIMPVNGSDVTISNSTLRTVGAWFERGDSVSVSGLINNSSYPSFSAPLNDRVLQLNNTDVQTWSLYVFDSSHIDVKSCIVGEIGTLGRATAFTESFLLDGSGGYFWASDTSFTVGVGVSVTANIRSERNGIFLFGYGTLANGIASATGQSVMITVQSTLPQDPIPYDEAVAWMANISQPASGFTNDLIAVTGSAWIDQGPLGSWMDFDSYSIGYRQAGDTLWSMLVNDSAAEVHNGGLASWNTAGLVPGGYELLLVVKNDLGDSITAVRPVTLMPGQVSVAEMQIGDLGYYVVPNPAGNQIAIMGDAAFPGVRKAQLFIFDLAGRTVMEHRIELSPGFSPEIDIRDVAPGLYLYKVYDESHAYQGRLEIIR